jgi:CSLREA domain-containing protein
MAFDAQGDLYVVNFRSATVSEFTPATDPEVVAKATPTITWPNPADITYGTALSATQLDATASVPGTFSYTPGSGAVLGIGSNQTLSATFTPTDTADYNGASASVSVNVAEAPSLVVTTLADESGPYDGQTSLREAIAYANTLAGASTITFQPGLTGTITLTGGVLTLSDTNGTMTIQGPGANLLALDGNNTTEVFFVGPRVSAVLSGLTIAHGHTSDGGGIYNQGTLTLNACNLSGNYGGADGGAIRNEGTLTITGCTVNRNLTGNIGGGIFNMGTITVSDSTFAANSAQATGGAIFNDGRVTVTNSTFDGNSAVQHGGGIANLFGGSVTLNNTIVASSPSGGDVYIDSGNGSRFAGSNDLLDDTSAGTNDSNGSFGASTLYNVAAGLDPSGLQTNGGPTQAVALLPGSPAIDAGSNAAAAGLSTDQRGQPRVSGGTVDIGAFESRGFNVVLTGGGGQSTQVNTAFANPLAVTVSSIDGASVAGGTVSFTAPASGASAVLSASSVTLASNGQASVAATANGSAGSYAVAISAGGSWGTSASLTNLKGTPTITWSDPADITYGTALSATQLDAMASVPGTFSYTPGSGTVLGIGPNQTLSATFTPTDTADYNSVTTSVTITVNKAAPSVSVSDAGGTYSGSAFPATATVNGGPSLEGVSPTLAYYAGTYTDPSQLAGLTPLGGAPTAAGSYTVLAAFAGSADYSAGSALANFSVGQATLTVTADDATRVYGQANPAFTDTISGFVNGDTSAVVSGSASLTTTATTTSPPGTYPIVAAPGTLSAVNYTFAFVNGTLTVYPVPTSGLSGPSDGVLYQPRTFTFTAAGAAGDAAAGFTYQINWGDGGPVQTVPATAGNTTLTETHAYTAAGNFSVSVTVTDQYGATSLPASQAIAVVATPQLQNGVLAVPGTAASATLTLTPTLPTGAAAYSMKVTRTIGTTTTNLGTFAVPTGTIAVYGGPGTDAVTLNGTTSNDAFTVGSGTVSELAAQNTAQATAFTVGLNAVTSLTLKGAGGSDSLTGPNQVNAWALTGGNAGTLDSTVAFSGIANLTGGAAGDTFSFAAGASVSGTIDGGGGANTLDFSGRTTAVTVTLVAGGPNKATATGAWTNIGTVIGSGAATNTLVGGNTTNVWDLTGTNAGTLNGTLAFSGFQNLTGGSVNDRFAFLPGGSISGNLQGGAPVNTLDYSGYGSPVTVNLGARTATGIGGTWANIQNVTGTSTTDTLIGPGTPTSTTTWTLTGTNAGTAGAFTFVGFVNLTGGAGNNSFLFSDGASVSGTVTGGSGTNTLDYSLYSTGVYVNLQTLTATGTGGIANIQNVTGGQGNDILVGNANANVLREKATKTGRDLIIDGGGADALTAGGGDDILIAGTTIYDRNAAALNALLATWASSALSYNQRVAALLNGVSYTDGSGTHVAALDADTTVTQPGGSGGSTLTGGGGLDWFFAAVTDTINNRKKGEIVSTL